MAAKKSSVLQDFASQYKAGVVVLTRPKGQARMARKVNVYVDGLLTVMSEDALQHLLDIGFYQQVPS